MAYIENNSTNIPLGAFQRFTGKSFKPSVDYVTIAISLNIPTSGTLQVLHSFDDINYFTFGDEYSYTAGSHSHQFSIKANFFKTSFENGAVPQTSFNLNTRILKVISEDFVLNKDFDTITVFPPQTGFLSSERDSITIPTLDDCITGINNDSLKVFVVNQSGGSASNVQIFDSNGSSLLSDGDGKLQVSGTFDVGFTNYALENDGHLESIDAKLDIVQGLTFLNNKLLVETGITGYATNSKLDEIKTAINEKHLNSTTDSVAVTSSTLATSALQTTANTKLDTINTSITNKHLDSTTDSVTVNLITGFATSALQTSTNTKLDTIHNDLVSIDGKIDGILTTDSSNNLLVYSSNIASTPLISGFATEETLQEIKVKTDDLTFSDNGGVIELRVFDSQNNISLNTINDTITNKHLDSATDSVTVSGTVTIDTSALATESTLSSLDGKVNNDTTLTDAIQVAIKNTSLDVNTGLDLSTLATEEKQDIQTEELVKVVNKKGDIEANIFYNQASTITADTVPPVGIYELDPNGWAYENANPGNAMNLFYFNGNNETKTLNQVVGQYAVVSNLSTKLNNSLIFGIYTKGSPFFTTRITHSPPGNVNLTAGGKFLVYWGEAVPDDLYPNLPRLNFTDITTTGPAVPTEEILSVSLNTDSGAPAGDVLIFVESLGVVFNNGSVNQSRVLNLLSNRTPYILSSSTEEFTQSINTYLSQLNKTNDGLDVYIKNDTPISVSVSNTTPISVYFDSGITVLNTSFEISNFPAIQPVSFDSGITVLNTSFEISNFPAIQQVAFDSGITVLNTGFDVNNFPAIQPVSFDSGITVLNTGFDVNNFPSNQVVSGTVAISNTGFDVNNFPTKFDSHIYASKNGNPNSVEILKSDNHQHLLTRLTNDGETAFNTFDADGGINCHITNSTIGVTGVFWPSTQPISGSVNANITNSLVGVTGAVDINAFDGLTRTKVACDASGRILTKSNIASGFGDAITSTDTTATTQSLDTASVIYVSDGTTRTALTATSGNLNTNITNSSLTTSVSNSFTLDTTTQSTNTKIDSTNTKLDTGNGYLNTINNATGDFTTTFTFGNFISNETLTGGSDSSTETFTKGSYKRNVIAIYRDGSTANTDSISFYAVATSGSPTNLLLATVYPITVGGFRQVTINLNLLPFNSLFIKNDSASTINNVYLTVLNG
jgi:hypothetical protein